MKLPVYKVASTVAAADRIRDLGKQIFPREDHQIVERGTKVELRSKVGNIEVDVGRGGVWGSDNTRLWSVDPRSGQKRGLYSKAQAKKLGLELLEKHGVLPEIAAPFRLKAANATGTVTAYSPSDGAPREVIQEDTTLLVDMEVDVSDSGLKKKTLPIVGGGGRLGILFFEA